MATMIEPAEIREEVRNAFLALREAGETASVRQVWNVIGGTYGTVAQECKLLRAAYGEAAASEGTREPLPAGEEVLPVQAAEVALDAARQAQARVLEAARQAQEEHERCEQQVLALQRQMLAGALVEASLTTARTARLLAYLAIGDARILAEEQEALVADAEAALADATRRAELAAYNTLAAGRAPLVAAVQDAVAQLEAALHPLLVHHAQQLTQAEQLGFAQLLTSTPFAATPSDARNLTAYSVLGFWLYERLAALVPAPSHDIDPRMRLRVDNLAAVDAAYAHQLPWDAYVQATSKERRVEVRLLANPTPEGSNLLVLAEAGLPGVLSPLAPVVLPRLAVEVLRQHTHALQVVGDVGD